VIPTRGGVPALDACLRAIRIYWPQAVFENATDVGGADPYQHFSIGDARELFAYRDADAAKEWDENGADPSTSNTMIHVLLSEDTITLVVDDAEDLPMAALLRSVSSMLLRNETLNITATRSAA